MRKLNTNDLIKCSALLGKIGKQIELQEGMSNAQIGITIFSTIMQYAESDFKIILADIAEMPIEEFEKQDFDFPLLILEEIAEKQDLLSFFIRVQNLTRKLQRK